MVDTKRYKIIFSGEIVENRDISLAKQKLAIALKTDSDRIESLFDGKKHLLSKNLTKADALNYQQQLEERIGIIVTIESESSTTSTSNKNAEIQQKSESNNNRPKNRITTALLSLGLIASLGFIGYSYIQNEEAKTAQIETVKTLNQKIEILNDDNSMLNNNLLEIKKSLSIPAEREIIPSCKAEAVEALTSRLLLEGFPQLIEQSNPNLNITNIKLENTQNETEALYDLQRNIRLCSLVAEFSIDAEDNKQENILFNILYQIYYDNKGELSLSTIKHSLLGVRAN